MTTTIQAQYHDAPPQKWRRLRRCIPRAMQPYLRGLRKRAQRMRMDLDEPYYSVFPYTQVSQIRQRNLVRLGGLVNDRGVPGAFVECGVLDGGSAALVAHATRDREPARPVHLFDAWQGLPPTVAQDGRASEVWTGEAVGSPRRVRRVMRQLKIDPARLCFHVGWFSDTFPRAQIDEIALLHIDADFYEPVRLCLQRWYPVVSSGGYVQLDDYSEFAGCRKATDEFLRDHPEVTLESHGRYAPAFFFRKP